MPTPKHPERVWSPPFLTANGGGQLQVSATAWASYLGFVDAPITLNALECLLTTAGAGTETAEFGLFSSPAAPNGAGQTLTKLIATATLTSMTSGAPKIVKNTTPFAVAIPAGTFLWGVTRFAYSVTQPTIAEGSPHTILGDVLILTSASALTGISTLAMTQPDIATVNHGAPLCTATEDA